MNKTDFLQNLSDKLNKVNASQDLINEQLALFANFFDVAPKSETDALLCDEENANNIINEIAIRAAAVSADKLPVEELDCVAETSEGDYSENGSAEEQEITEQFTLTDNETEFVSEQQNPLQEADAFPLLDFEEEITSESIDEIDDKMPIPDSDIFDEIINSCETYNYEDITDDASQTRQALHYDEDSDNIREYIPPKKETNIIQKHRTKPKFVLAAIASLPITLPLAILSFFIFLASYAILTFLSAVALAAVIASAVIGITLIFISISSAISAFTGSVCAGIFEIGIGIVGIGLAVLTASVCAIFIVNIPMIFKKLTRAFSIIFAKIKNAVNSAKGVFDKQ